MTAQARRAPTPAPIPTSIEADRGSLFISHASEDTDFALWLGARLSAAGYDVWADFLSLKGGDDWQTVLANALRSKARKMLLVATNQGVEKLGVKREILIAEDVSKKLKDPAFKIPLRLEPFTAPYLVSENQWINFENGWGQGLAELLETLQTVEGLHRTTGLNQESMARWLDAQRSKSAKLNPAPEVLVSNWLPLRETPPTIRYFAFSGAGAGQHAETAVEAYQIPAYKHGTGFFGFGSKDDYADTPSGAIPRLTQEIPLDDFKRDGFESLGIGGREGRNILSYLMRTALEKALSARGLSVHSYSGRTKCFWVHAGLTGKDRVPFDWKDGWQGSRSLCGEVKRGTKRVRWHYGVSVHVRVEDESYVQLTPRLLFTENGRDITFKPAKLHALRRSVPRSWRNDRWRDLMLAFLYWLTDGRPFFDVPTGADRQFRFSAMPATMQVPVSITSPNDKVDEASLEEGDPVFESEFAEGDTPDDEDPEA